LIAMRTKEIVGAILALTLFLGIAPIALAAAPGTPFQVGGHVYMDTAPVPGADVTVTDQDTGESLTTTTDSNGAYVVALGNLPSGHSAGDTLEVTATYNGMTGTNSASRSENLGDSPQIIDVTMVAGDTTNPTIRSVTLDNATVNASETFLVTVNATDASGIASVTANATTGTVTLTSTGGDDWEGTLTAPNTSGVYTVTVVATDTSPNTNKATDTSEQISVIPLPTSQEASYDVNDTPTEDNNTVTISDNGAITADNPLNDTVSIDLGNDTKLVIEINVNSTDNKTGTVASVTLDTPAVTASGTWEQNESVDVDLNLNDSVWIGSNTINLTIQPLNDIDDKLHDGALGNATSAILELQGATTAMVMQATLSGTDESNVKSLPIEMTVDADWYNSQDKVYLFKFYENGTEKQRKPPNSVSHNEANGTYTLSFEMDGFSIFALVGTKTAALPHRGGGGGSGGTYPPGWGTTTTTPVVTATAAHGATPGATTAPSGKHVTPTPKKPVTAGTAATAAEGATAGAAAKKKPGIPGFTAVFAIAGMLALAYVLMRRRE